MHGSYESKFGIHFSLSYNYFDTSKQNIFPYISLTLMIFYIAFTEIKVIIRQIKMNNKFRLVTAMHRNGPLPSFLDGCKQIVGFCNKLAVYIAVKYFFGMFK